MAETKPIVEGPLSVTFDVEQGHLIKRTTQADRDILLEANKEDRKKPQRGCLGGWQVGSIPMLDWHFKVLPKYPELASSDAELARAALIRFSNDPEMSPYLIKKA